MGFYKDIDIENEYLHNELLACTGYYQIDWDELMDAHNAVNNLVNLDGDDDE